MATKAGASVFAVFVGAGADAIQRPFRQGGNIIVAMLIDARVARQAMAGVERHHFAAPFFAGGEHLHDHGVGDIFHRGAARGGVERYRRRRRAVDDRARRRDHFDGAQRAVVFRQIVGERAENRFVAGAEGRMVGHS